MSTTSEVLARYQTPFQRHLAFFDRDNDGLLHFGESLRGNLAIGLDFPVAVVFALGYHTIYGNTRPFFFGPFNPIDIARVDTQRNMLEQIRLEDVPLRGMGRQTLVAASYPRGFMDRMHVNCLWAFAANRQGYISAQDIELYQQGIMLHELEKRRKDNRDHVLPLYRGGPISVSGHSWFVDKLFGVKVYQVSQSKNK